MATATTPKTQTKAWIALVVLLVVALFAAAFLYGRNRIDGEGTVTGQYDGPTIERPRAAGGVESEFDPVLEVNDTDVFDYLAGGGRLSEFVNQEISGENAPVLKVINETTYWVGPSEDEAVLVAIDVTDPGAEVQRGALSGDIVDLEEKTLVEFRGVVREVHEDTAFEVGDEEDEARLMRQGAYVYAQVFNIDS